MGDDDVRDPTPASLDETDAEAERFFAQGDAASAEADSLAPLDIEQEDSGPPPPRPVSPELRLRRARLRRTVAIGLTSGVAVLISGIGAARLSKSSATELTAAPASFTPLVRAPVRAAPPTGEPARAASAAPLAIPPPAPSSTAVAPPPAASARSWLSEARTLLGAGRVREGVDAARAAIAADPALAEPYVLLGAGLQDLGDWNEAYRTFATCAERTHSAVCKYFARKTR